MVETRSCQSRLRPHLQGLRDTEPLGYGARKKAFRDLSLTFRSTLSNPQGSGILDLPVRPSWKGRCCLSPAPHPYLPGHSRGPTQAGAGWHLSALIILWLCYKTCHTSSALCHPFFIFFFFNPSPPCLFCCWPATRKTEDLQTLNC